MSKVKIQGNPGGTGIFTITAPPTNTDRTITLPDKDLDLSTIPDNAITTTDTNVITAEMLSTNLRCWELITSYDVTAGQQITLDNIFNSTYDYYQIFVSDLTCTNNDFGGGNPAAIRFLDTSGNQLSANLYGTSGIWRRSSDTTFNDLSYTNVSYGAISRRFPSNSGSRGYDGLWVINKPLDSTKGPRMTLNGIQDSYDDTINQVNAVVGYRSQVAIRGLYLYTYGDSGGFATGNFKVYGMRG